MSEDLVRSERQGPVAVLRLQDDRALNALGAALVTGLSDALEDARRDPEVRAVVITGSDRAFCAGAHIPEVLALRETVAADPDAEVYLDRLFDLLETSPHPVIAAVRGLALGGGCELALACDLIVAGESASFGLPEVRLGLIPGAGGTQRLVHAVGKAKAVRMLMTGEPVDAAWAEAAGLVAEVVADDEVLGRAVDLARRAARNAPDAVRLAVDCARRADGLPLPDGLAHERRAFLEALASDDAAEGLDAFTHKRPPEFAAR